MKMMTGRISMRFFLLLILFHFYAFHVASTSLLAPPAFASSSETNLSYILQDVLKKISASEKWNLKNVRVSKLDVGKVRFAISQSYDFHIELGKKELALKIADQFDSWSKFRKPKFDLGSLIHTVTSLTVLDTLEVEGPLELRVDDPHQVSLFLPMNISFTGLKQIFVGEGITLQVREAREVSFFYPSDLDLLMSGSTMFSWLSEWERGFWPFLQSSCMHLISINISGTASAAAYVDRIPGLYIETTFISEDTIVLRPEKSYHVTPTYIKWSCPSDPLSMRLSMLEKILRSLLGRRVLQNRMSVSLKANSKAGAAVKFPIQLEAEIFAFKFGFALKDAFYNWRTKVKTRVWYEIVARVEADRLKTISFQKVKPVSVTWGDLKSNESFIVLDDSFVPWEATF